MKRVSIVIVLIVWLVQFSNAATYYVDINGNDASGDGSPGKPWRTIRFALSKVPANQGHTIKISAGTFIEQGPLDVPVQVNIEGSGSSATIVKAASSFYYLQTSGFITSKILFQLTSPSFSSGNQSLKNFTIDGDNRNLYGGIIVRRRSKVLIEGVNVQYVGFTGIWFWDAKDCRLTNATLKDCAWFSSAYATASVSISQVERIEIDHINVDETYGAAIKALGTPEAAIHYCKIHDNFLSTDPTGRWEGWNGTTTPAIVLEMLDHDLIGNELYNNKFEGNVSLVYWKTKWRDPTGTPTIRVYNNIFDCLTRSKGNSYGLELSIHDVEIDHNYFYGGKWGITDWEHRGDLVPYQNWKIHHNIFYEIKGATPGIIRTENKGLRNLEIYNNTVEFTGQKEISFLQLVGGSSSNVKIKNNLIINNTTGPYAYYPPQFIRISTGAVLNGLQATNNILQNLPIGNVPGTYSSNLSGDPQINKSGNRADPYYRLKATSPCIDKGANVGFPYSGSAPDIGAYEYGSTTTPPTNTPPSIGLSAPSNNASFAAGSSITLSANAADANGTVSKVEFFNGATKLGEDATGPYSFVWNNVAAGTYTITAKATDNQGATTTSSPVTITVVGNTNTAPTVNITSPANNANFNAGSSITINANATDANGTVSKVEFFNGTTKLGEDTSSPYSFTWSNVVAGTYSITARATDNQNAITNSAAITIVVNAANALPTVNLTGPANNSTFTAPASLTLTATAADADGTVTKVEFFNGTTKLGEDTSSPYSFNWNNVAAGTYSLTARATDNRNAITNSAVVTLNVRANTLPSVSITSPANNSTFTTNSSITITANATDANGTITKVEFYYGNTKLGEDATSPYSITWGNVPAGTYLLKAVAFDNNGGSSTSANITVTVGNLSNSLPSVSLTSPGNNAAFLQGSVITLTASASDSDGSIAKVEFYNGTTKLGEDTANPYAFVWNNVPAGNYSLTAKATDDKNGVSTSAAVNINVTSPNSLPVANAGKDATVTLPDNTYLLQGSGEDSDGIIMNYEWTQVEGPNDATLTVSAGGEAMITNLVEGTYKFVLTVTDNGDLSSSDEIIIKVIPVSPASVQLPLVFTPNNDGIDDTWNWSNTEAFENCRLTIYNRLGQKIYETISYDNTWDGRVNGSPLQEDAYYYVITCDNSDRQGAVRIVR